MTTDKIRDPKNVTLHMFVGYNRDFFFLALALIDALLLGIRLVCFRVFNRQIAINGRLLAPQFLDWFFDDDKFYMHGREASSFDMELQEDEWVSGRLLVCISWRRFSHFSFSATPSFS